MKNMKKAYRLYREGFLGITPDTVIATCNSIRECHDKMNEFMNDNPTLTEDKFYIIEVLVVNKD